MKYTPKGRRWIIVNDENKKFVGFYEVTSTYGIKREIYNLNENYSIYGKVFGIYDIKMTKGVKKYDY
jgi:hypothetical protein